MREWLIMMISNWFSGMRTKSGPNTETVENVESEEKTAMPPCPICGEVWDEKEVFCYYCGYQTSDENIPLHPPPERNSGLTDPDKVLPESEFARLREKFDSISESKRIDIAILILPLGLREQLRFDEERYKGYTIDGLAFALYNTWKMGSGSGLKGILVVVDPNGPDRVLVTGKNGPKISGSVFRSWFDEAKTSEVLSDANFQAALVKELEHIAGKIEGIG